MEFLAHQLSRTKKDTSRKKIEMVNEDTFTEIYDLFENRLNQLGPIRTDDIWRICRGKTQRSYVTISNVFRECMNSMVEQGKATYEKRGLWEIKKPNCKL